MRAYRIGMAAVLAAIATIGPAAAAPCFIVIDRNETTIYRDTTPPYDLSDPKAPQRSAMRQRGEHLLIAEFETCNPAGFISPTTGGTTATVDDIVMQLKPAIMPGTGSAISKY